MKKVVKKYSSIMRCLDDYSVSDNDYRANFTHYLHNIETKDGARFYKKINKDHRKYIQEVMFKWDVPFPPPENSRFTFVDLFAGIGGMRIAFQNLGGKCLFSSEWEISAQKTYETNFGEQPFGDITKIDADFIPDHDVLLAGFPCQPFSIAGVSKKKSLGKEHGFLDKAQGTLFFDVARIIKTKRPKAFLLENVKNLKSHDKGRTFQIIESTLKEMKYDLHVKILDGAAYVPQHRERIMIVGFDQKVFGQKVDYIFPQKNVNGHHLGRILEKDVDNKYTLSDKLWIYLQEYAKKHREKGNGFGFGMADVNSHTRTLSARYYKDGSEILIPQRKSNPRRLTPRECARLQGFPDTFKIPVADTPAYRQFGNSVVIPLIQDVGRGLVDIITGGKLVNEKRRAG